MVDVCKGDEMKVVVDTDEIVDALFKAGGEMHFTWMFVKVMYECYPDMMDSIDTKLIQLQGAVQAVVDADLSNKPYTFNDLFNQGETE
jgi:hypothetical protein